MVILMIAGVLAAFFAVRALNGANTERDKVTAAALAQAKDALIGFAVTYRDTHPGQLFGFLPCPDSLNNDGIVDGCGVGDVSAMSWLPWRTLEIPPLRDSAGECLWYAVSGTAKDIPKTAAFNWDTTGQFVVRDADGSLLHGASPHDRPMAMILAPRTSINGLSRAGPATECHGSNNIAAYLDGGAVDPFYLGTAPAPNATTTLVLSTQVSANGGVNNDQGISITSKEIFDRVKRRRDFKADIDTLIGDLADYLNGLPVATLPGTSVGRKGVDVLISDFDTLHAAAWPALKAAVQNDWRNNLLYARPAGPSTVNGTAGCNAVLLFGGERTLRTAVPLTAQIRATPAQTGSPAVFGDPAMYLEGVNTIFPGGGAYVGADFFDPTAASADLVRCIKGLAPGSQQQSFATDISTFYSVGVGVTVPPGTQTVSIVDAPGLGGGCFWSPTLFPLAGKVLRAYYDYQFSFADPFALTSVPPDRGNGFTISFVKGDIPVVPPTIPPSFLPPNTCGTEAAMGALGAADIWGSDSIIVETDVRRDIPIISDPVENHTAIMLNGNMDHTGPGDTMSAACNGTATGCRHNPANRFEETPLRTHNQRIEIHTGCNAACTVCNPPTHGAPNNYARVTAWTDCKDCNNTAADVNRVTVVPTIQRCLALNPALNTVFFGFTGGFRSGGSQQGVTLNNLIVRSE